MAEDERQIFIQVQQFIERMAEYFCNPTVEEEKQPVFPERPGRDEKMRCTRLRSLGPVEYKRDGITAYIDITRTISDFIHAVHKGIHHLPVAKSDGNIHFQQFRYRIAAHAEAGQPPVLSA